MSQRVIMNLTDRDIEITDKLTKKLRLRNNASTVSSALAIVYELTEMAEGGGTLLMRGRDGSMERLIIPGVRRA